MSERDCVDIDSRSCGNYAANARCVGKSRIKRMRMDPERNVSERRKRLGSASYCNFLVTETFLHSFHRLGQPVISLAIILHRPGAPINTAPSPAFVTQSF